MLATDASRGIVVPLAPSPSFPAAVGPQPSPAVSLAFPAQPPAILGWSERRQTLTTALIGLALGVCFAVTVSGVAPKEGMLARLFDLHGASSLVPISISVMFFWGAATCALRWRRQRALESVASHSLLLAAVRQLANSGPQAVATYLERPGFAVSPLLVRLLAVLRQWRLRPGLVEADLVLQQHHAQDDEKVRRGFQLTRAFVWAMPVVGLMGTVIGISLAVGGFAQLLGGSVDDIGVIKHSLVGVTKGLSFAFMITLEGLLGALLVMLPAVSLQGREEGFLVALQHAIAGKFLPELQRVAPAQETRPDGPAINPADLESAFRRALADAPLAQVWQEQLARHGEAAAARLAQTAETVGAGVIQALGQASGEIAAGWLAIVQRQEKTAQGLVTDFQAAHSEVRSLVDVIAQRLGAAAGQLGEHFAELNAREADRLQALVRELDQGSRDLGAGLAAHQEAFRATVEQWREEGPRVDSYFAALQQLGQSVERTVAVQREIQDEMAALNAQGTLAQVLEDVQRTLTGLEPFLRRLTGTFHFVTAVDVMPDAMFEHGR
jgi:biopolymer transport protein ExbB/TolQ